MGSKLECVKSPGNLRIHSIKDLRHGTNRSGRVQSSWTVIGWQGQELFTYNYVKFSTGKLAEMAAKTTNKQWLNGE